MNSRTAFDARRYILAETAISVAINSAVTLLPHFLLAGGDPVLAAGGLTLGAVPPLFMTGFMSALVPSLLTRARLRKGKLPPGPVGPPVGAIVALALVLGALGLVLAGTVLPRMADGGPGAILRHAYGAVLGAFATPAALLLLFGPKWAAHRTGIRNAPSHT